MSKVCPFCREELSRAAYYRHLNDKQGLLCPGERTEDFSDSSMSDSDQDLFTSSESLSLGKSDSDTTFDFEDGTSPTNNLPDGIMQEDYDASTSAELPPERDSHSPVSSSSSDSDLSGEEIWEDTESEDEQETSISNTVSNTTRRILFGLSIFVTTFQLFFRISERAMSALLLFIHTLVGYLAQVVNSPLLQQLSQVVPKAMETARKNTNFSIN